MSQKKVFQLNSELFKVTGIQRVLLDIHEALRDDFDTKIVGNIPYDRVDVNLGISESDYQRFKNPLMFHKSVVIIHERRLLPLMWVLTHVPGLEVECVYIHHSELYGNKLLSLFPKNIVAISDAGIRNLTDYFGVPRGNITKIHNCVRETTPFEPRTKKFDSDNINILYPARINSGKRQIEIVNRLKGKLDSRIRILFAGTGPQYEELERLCRDSKQFIALGFRNDIPDLMQESDFMLLFSKQEGLPISLIEATMTGLPAICNNVGGNIEIVQDGRNGIVTDEWDSLVDVLNKLPNLKQSNIDKMSTAGRDIYTTSFNFTNFKKNYCKLINSLK